MTHIFDTMTQSFGTFTHIFSTMMHIFGTMMHICGTKTHIFGTIMHIYRFWPFLTLLPVREGRLLAVCGIFYKRQTLDLLGHIRWVIYIYYSSVRLYACHAQGSPTPGFKKIICSVLVKYYFCNNLFLSVWYFLNLLHLLLILKTKRNIIFLYIIVKMFSINCNSLNFASQLTGEF